MSHPSETWVRRQDRGPVAILTMDRADEANALSRKRIDELVDRLDELSAEPGVRSLVLAGSVSVFSLGVAPTQSEISSRSVVPDAQALADLIDRVHRFPRPVVSALEGDAQGAGAALALAADLVVMGDSARIGFPEVTRGLVPALILPDLVRQIGDRRARELLLTGRMVDSDQALAWGLVNRVVISEHVREEAIRWAGELALNGPMALATTKNLLDETGQRPRTLRGAAAISAAVTDSDEAREGMEASLQARPPVWRVSHEADRHLPDDRLDVGIDPDLTRRGDP